jgi:hypothetical protein
MNNKEATLFKNKLISKMASKAGLRGKIDAKCIECIYDPYCAGTWRKQVEECTSLACPIYPVRPTSLQLTEK